MHDNTTKTNDEYIDELNSFLRGEISAVETYTLAITQIGGDHLGALSKNRDSHSNRVALLREKINAAGGTPDATSGAWGGFTKLVEKGAALVGKKAILAALEEGEDHGLREYRDHDDLEDPALDLVQNDLLHEQEETHGRMSMLKKSEWGSKTT